MCAEALFWQCHRRLVSDFLVANGVMVQHIMPTGALRLHKLSTGAAIVNGQVTYPGEPSLFASGHGLPRCRDDPAKKEGVSK